MADYYLEQEIMLTDLWGECDELMWETKDEGKIAVSKMKNSHIKNCINMLVRRKQDADFWLAVFEDELKNRKV